MKEGNAGDQLAVLIDGDNVSHKVVAGLMAEIANYGTASVKRIYGDWSSPTMKSWSESLLDHSIIPMQQFAYVHGKNATDIAMVIDAMDLLYTGRFSSFCLVSSDSDFTRLAARIREQGISVYGFGERKTTNKALINACNEFVYFDALPMLAEEAGPTRSLWPEPNQTSSTNILLTPDSVSHPERHSSFENVQAEHPLPSRPTPRVITATQRRPLDDLALNALRQAIRGSKVFEDDYVNLSYVGHLLTRLSPYSRPGNYGFARLKDFVQASGIVDIEIKSFGGAAPIPLVRLSEDDGS